MNRKLIARPLTLFLLAAAAAGAAEPDPAEIDKIFAEWDSTRSPGCSLGVYRGGEIAYARGYGMTNLEYGIANSPQSVFRIGSTSKQFAAMAIAILAAAGELDLDDELQKHFPELPDYGTPVTVRHLVHHTSGLRDYLTLADLAEWSEDFSVAESVAMIARQRALNFAPGSRFLYSNSNYFLMSQLVERVTGQTLRQWADEHMFGPLGMRDTHFHDDHNHIVPRRADGYSPREGGGFRTDMTILDHVGDGGVYTTVEDLLLWDDNFYANRLGKGTPALIERVTTPAALTGGESSGYGFGLFVGDHRGVPMIHHGGAWVGYRAAMNRFPEQRLTVAVLCNLSSISPSRLAISVAELYLADVLAPAPPSEDSASEDSPSEESAPIAPATVERVAGAYWDREDFAFRRIVARDGKLFYHRGGDSDNELRPRADGGFLMLDVPVRVVVRFEPREGPAEQMVVEVEGDEPGVLERYLPVLPSAADLAAFAGTYYSPELDHTQVLAVEDGALVARREEDMILAPTLADIFAEGFVSLSFERDGEGRLTGYRLNAGRVRNLRYERVGARDPAASSGDPSPAAGGSPTESWRCRNDIEVRCGEGSCEAETGDGFTPMSVSVDGSGAIAVCAYSGCWEGTGAVVPGEEFLLLVGRGLEFSTARGPGSAADVVIAIDRGDGVATLKAGEFAHPLLCESSGEGQR